MRGGVPPRVTGKNACPTTACPPTLHMSFRASEPDLLLLRRALRLAMNGRGLVEPNPMVGCVLTKDGRVLGEGWHEQFGGPHAEPNALADCRRRGQDPAGATAYVTLEPCCHTNKKTPPCAPRLIEARVARVVIGCLDPNPAVNGNGVAMLRAAGIEVDGPVLEGEAKQLIAPFLARVQSGRPYVTLKWAQTADGKVAGPGGRPARISNDQSWRVVHELRSRCDAILIGAGTALSDNPLLTARVERRVRIPTRVVLDSGLRVGPRTRLAESASEAPVLVFFDPRRADQADARRLRECGVELVPIEGAGAIPLCDVLAELGRRGMTHVLVEPGPTLAAAFFETGPVDRLWVFRSPSVVNDASAPAAVPPPPDFRPTVDANLSGDHLTEYLNPRSEAFFAATPSADFMLATASPAGPP
jgi:diaminohydroxyphosphoribosylaminopyrimidine deaminase/5-amino-6-(5-phosphoribosylamino)uracil reductase